MFFQPSEMDLEVAQSTPITQRLLLNFLSREWRMRTLSLGKMIFTSCRAEGFSVQECRRRGKANDRRKK
eukprot:282635-Pyramimonas_sp.AAC.1